MLVRDVMQWRVVTVSPATSVAEAVLLAQARGIRHLPVVEDDTLLGIVSDRDLKRAMPSSAAMPRVAEAQAFLDEVPVKDIMTRTVRTTGPMFPVEEAARVMASEKISALPVTEGGRLIGIVTETDVLDLFVRAMGAHEPSSRMDVELPARPGALTDVVQAIEAAGVTISSVMTLVNRNGLREAIIRVSTINPGPAVHGLEARGYSVRDSWRS
jgi:acetoin utilization protein AcuB